MLFQHLKGEPYFSNFARTSATIVRLSMALSTCPLYSNKANIFLLSSMARPRINFSTTWKTYLEALSSDVDVWFTHAWLHLLLRGSGWCDRVQAVTSSLTPETKYVCFPLTVSVNLALTFFLFHSLPGEGTGEEEH